MSGSEPVNSRQNFRVNRLSPYQRAVLRWVLDRYRECEEPGMLSDSGRGQLRIWGVPVWRREACSRSESASRSRALRRLEADGLIRRRSQVSGDWYQPDGIPDYGTQPRTTHLQLTEAGRALAETAVPAS